MECSLAKHSRKEKLTKDDIPTLIEPVIDTVQAIFPYRQDFEEYGIQRKGSQCSIRKEKQNNESTGSLRPANASTNLSNIDPNQIEVEHAVELAVVMATATQHGTMVS